MFATEAMEGNLLLIALVMMSFAIVLEYLGRKRRHPTAIAMVSLLVVTTVLLFCAVLGRWLREGQGPFLTLYDVLLSNLFTLNLIYLIIYMLYVKSRASAVIVMPFFALLGVWLLQLPAAAIPLPATFDNPWLWMHVLSGKLFLGFYLVPAALSVILLYAALAARLARNPVNANSIALDSEIWPLFALAFICHSFMLIAGAVWAHSAWGRYWAWDPLETWALITWLAMALLLHVRVTYRQLPRAIAWASVVAIFCLAFLTFFGVPFVSLAPHKGVM
jgi:ABC-type transport system involved in cytochrome c biogenesis permease subunit